MCHVCFYPITPVPSLRARAHLSPLLCLLLVCNCAHLASAGWFSPNWWIQAMVTGVELKQWSMDHWWMMAWITGSLVDDARIALLVLCLCQILWHSSSFPAELISRSVFHHDCLCLCRLPFPYVPLTLEVADCLDIDACNLKAFSIRRSNWLLLTLLQRSLEWWLSFNFSLRW